MIDIYANAIHAAVEAAINALIEAETSGNSLDHPDTIECAKVWAQVAALETIKSPADKAALRKALGIAFGFEVQDGPPTPGSPTGKPFLRVIKGGAA